jgi:hypothetical protein
VFWWGGSMERVRYRPKVGEVCTYHGVKEVIRGFPVICTRHKSKTSVWIQGYGTSTKWDTKEWSCTTSFLSPLQPAEPDWEV